MPSRKKALSFETQDEPKGQQGRSASIYDLMIESSGETLVAAVEPSSGRIIGEAGSMA